MPPMKAYASFDAYEQDQTPRNQAIIRALRRFVRSAQPRLIESVKWGNGCWVTESGPVAYVYSGANWVQFGFFRGASLLDPHGLLEGKGQYVRHIKVRTAAGIKRQAFSALIKQAAAFRKAARSTGSRTTPQKARRRSGKPKRAPSN